MDAELVTIGTELLLGFTIDTNAAFLGQALGTVGVRITRRSTVPDEPGPIRETVAEGLGRTRLVIVSGGLGPTHDDVTKRVVAELVQAPLDFDPAIWDMLVSRFARLGRVLAERNRCQAEVPRGAVVLPNPRGTAPGLWLTSLLGEVILLPGVPHEFRGLVENHVVPRLADRNRDTVVRSLVIRTTGIAESALADRLAPLESELAPLTLASLPGLDGVDLRLTAWNLPREQADHRLEAQGIRLRELAGEHAYGTDGDDLAGLLLSECRLRGLRLAVAESCTGGMLGGRITEVPGSSDVFVGGMIAYGDSVKEELGVPARILETHGAVSEETAAEMARALLQKLQVTLAIAVTGIAGPDGGSEAKPVGLVWFAIANEKETLTHRVIFPGARHDVRTRACQFALWRAWLMVRAGNRFQP